MKISAEISFNRYFLRPDPIRPREKNRPDPGGEREAASGHWGIARAKADHRFHRSSGSLSTPQASAVGQDRRVHGTIAPGDRSMWAGRGLARRIGRHGRMSPVGFYTRHAGAAAFRQKAMNSIEVTQGRLDLANGYSAKRTPCDGKHIVAAIEVGADVLGATVGIPQSDGGFCPCNDVR